MHTRETSFWGVLKSFITLLSNETFGIWARFWLWSDGMERCSYSKKRGRVRSELSQLQSSVNWKILKPDQRKSLSACESCRWFFKNTAAHVFLYIGWLDKWEVRIDSLWVSITVNPLASQIALVCARVRLCVCVCAIAFISPHHNTLSKPQLFLFCMFSQTHKTTKSLEGLITWMDVVRGTKVEANSSLRSVSEGRLPFLLRAYQGQSEFVASNHFCFFGAGNFVCAVSLSLCKRRERDTSTKKHHKE